MEKIDYGLKSICTSDKRLNRLINLLNKPLQLVLGTKDHDIVRAYIILTKKHRDKAVKHSRWLRGCCTTCGRQKKLSETNYKTCKLCYKRTRKWKAGVGNESHKLSSRIVRAKERCRYDYV